MSPKALALVVVAVTTGCGRLAFSPLDDEPDAAPLGPWTSGTPIAGGATPGLNEQDLSGAASKLELWYTIGGTNDAYVMTRSSPTEPWGAPQVASFSVMGAYDGGARLSVDDLTIYFMTGPHWTPDKLAICADATRILCVVGTLRALGFLGPPLLDGVGRPELTLRYMIVATFAVPGSFLLITHLLADHYGVVSMAIAWAVGYPLAFAALAYLVVKTIDLPVRQYLRGTWGIIASCLAGFVAGLAVSYAMKGSAPVERLLAIGGTALLVTFVLVGYWQKITPRSILRSLKG